MNHPTAHPLHDALHAHVHEGGSDTADPFLTGLADDALRLARRRQRLARSGAGVIAAAVIATVGVAVADGATLGAHPLRPAAGGTGNAEGPTRFSLLPITSKTDNACVPGSDGYPVNATATSPASCVHVDRAGGMTGVRAVSAQARNSAIGWEVALTLGPTDRTRLADLTRTLATATAPRNELAVVIDGRLREIALIAAPLTDGHFAIVSGLTSDTAHDLALRLGTGE
ncbi:SecDF P1 head subdomain-containing protein [Streptomyces sp. NPDC096142]|uniref:SecDF P1 head subdomain-containing protein n=1 Tax=Streptomyces sp. NPDC096142 TaxID=3366077 RepID=UPI003813C42F